MDLEVGFPVAASLDSTDTSDSSATEELRATGAEDSELPGGKRAATTLRGGYDLLAQAWMAFMEGVSEQGLKPGMPYWETYVTMPELEEDPGESVTELVVVVE